MGYLRFVMLVAATVAAAWLAAKARQTSAGSWLPPLPRPPPAGSEFVDGVTYVLPLRFADGPPALDSLPLPRTPGATSFPAGPTGPWLQARLCAGDERLLAHLSQLDDAALGEWSRWAARCQASDAGLCPRARAELRSADAGTLRSLYALVVAECAPAALDPWLDAPWVGLAARAAWLDQRGPTDRVDEQVLAALEADAGDEALDAVLRAAGRAPHDEAAAKRLLAVANRDDGGRSLLHMVVAGFETPSGEASRKRLCEGRDGGCPWARQELPLDAVELRAWLERGQARPWQLALPDGGSHAAAREVLASCALQGTQAEQCLATLSRIDWPLAAQVAEATDRGGETAEVLRHHPTRERFRAALGSCGVDAVAPEPADWHVALPHAEAELDSLWLTAPPLSELPYEERRARTDGEGTVLVAWTPTYRLEATGETGCNVSTNDLAVGLANVVLRELGSELRFYSLARSSRFVVLLERRTAACLRDAGLAEFVPAAPQD